MSSTAARRWGGRSLVLVWLALVAAPLAASELATPRPISRAEEAALDMVLAYLDQGVDTLWPHIAPTSPLQGLGRQDGLDELAVRLGPTTGAIWQLETPEVAAPEIVMFSVLQPSGVDDTVTFEMVFDGETWQIERVRCLIDPVSRAASFGAEAPPRLSPRTPALPAPSGSPMLFVLPGLLALAFLALALVAALGALVRGRGARRPALVELVTFLGLGGGALLIACGGGEGEGPRDAMPIVVHDDGAGTDASAFPRLARLLPLRQALATLESEDPASMLLELEAGTKLERRAATLLVAQRMLSDLTLDAAATALETIPPKSRLPLASLLRARLSTLRGDAARTREHYMDAEVQMPAHDGLLLEVVEALSLLGVPDLAQVVVERMTAAGSRHSEAHYYMAKVATFRQDFDDGEAHVRTAWSLRPMRRDELFGDVFLAFLASRPRVFPLFELSDTEDPTVRSPSMGKSALTLPPSAGAVTLLGEELSIEVGRARLIVPGGSILAPPGTTLDDAMAASRRKTVKALARFDAIVRAAQADAGALMRAEAMLIMEELVSTNQWQQLERLTRPIQPESVARVPPRMVQARAAALERLERSEEGRRLLIALARNDKANRRRDPGTLLQLADSFLSKGEYALAINLVMTAGRMSPFLQAYQERFLAKIRLEQSLVEDNGRLETKNFDILYPRTSGEVRPRQIAAVLEEEYERLKRWIPVPRDHPPIEVHLYGFEEFVRGFGSGISIVGLFDGKLRVPFARVGTLTPRLVSILSHELAHAMISEATADQAPRWFNEGLAQHIQMVQDTSNPFPELDATGRVLSTPALEAILSGFSEGQFVSLAYSESAWLVHFVENRWGVAGIHRLLDAFASGASTSLAVERSLGLSLAAFDKSARSWALDKAPDVWEVELRDYTRELDDRIIQRTAEAPAYQSGTRAKPASVALENKLPERPRRRLPDGRQPERAGRKKPEMPKLTFTPPPPKLPANLNAMQDWHPKYMRLAQPVRRALQSAMPVLEGSGAESLQEACGRLQTAVSAIRSEAGVLEPPDRFVKRTLDTAYQKLHSLAVSCRRGETRLARQNLVEAERALREAAKYLKPYDLRP